jgi:sugar O-acyltransferase (sialic acid O-acetyltransferase NeuD family)
MRSKRMMIVGAGGHGLVVADLCDLLGDWHEIVFLDDRFPEIATCGDWRVVGKISAMAAAVAGGSAFALGIGSNNVRMRLFDIFRDQGANFPVLIHPSAAVSKRSRIGAGSVVLATAAINTDVEIGAGAIINTGASVDHECHLEDGVHICPGARLAGAVRVGSLAMIGIGSCVKQGVTIGAGVVVGAGAAVVADIPTGVVVAGVPARRLGQFEGGH